jgi:hypothetical protein
VPYAQEDVIKRTDRQSVKASQQTDWSREFQWSEDSFDLMFRHNGTDDVVSKETNARVSMDFSAATEVVIGEMCAGMQHDAQLFRDLVTKSKPILTPQEFFPWLPFQPYELMFKVSIPAPLSSERLTLASPLPGQSAELSIPIGKLSLVHHSGRAFFETSMVEFIVVDYMSLQPGNFPTIDLVTFELVSTAFMAGSIIDKVKIKKRVLTVAAAILMPALATAAGDQIYHWGLNYEATTRINEKIAKRLDTATKGPIMEFCGSRLSLDALRGSTEKSFYYSEKGISRMEYTCRSAAVQTIAHMVLNTSLAVDGNAGKHTKEQEREIGLLTHTSGLNEDEIFRGALARKAYEILNAKPSPDVPTDPNP